MQNTNRVFKDIKELEQNPIPHANAVPSENDLSLWHCNINIPLTFDSEIKYAPIHFLIDLPVDYPKSAPNVGFVTNFPYKMGASMFISNKESRLNGLFTLCLNILGNFAFIHTEWIKTVGQGWSPVFLLFSEIKFQINEFNYFIFYFFIIIIGHDNYIFANEFVIYIK